MSMSIDQLPPSPSPSPSPPFALGACNPTMTTQQNNNPTDDDTTNAKAYADYFFDNIDNNAGTITSLWQLSKDIILYTKKPELDALTRTYNTNAKRKELLLLYEAALNITSIRGRLTKTNWAEGTSITRANRLTGWNAFTMRHSVEGQISRQLGQRFNFVSIVHFILFMLANNGYKREHRTSKNAVSVSESDPRNGVWTQLPRRIRDGYVVAAVIFKESSIEI